MQQSNAPGKLVLPFAGAGGKNSIPVASQIGIVPGGASLTDGFPPLTRTPIAAGGVPPSGLDMNGILYDVSAVVRWANAGGGYPYDSAFANNSNVGGYPKGARVMRSDGTGYWFNTADNNVTDPEGAGAVAAGWLPDFTTGAAAITMTSANVTLSAAQYGKPLIVITGTLTANLNLIFPAIVGDWNVLNSTTGNFTITAKTASGSGVTVPQNFVTGLVSDGLTVYSGFADLSGQNGANLVGFTQSGANARLRTLQTKVREGYVSITDYNGFTGDGVADDSSAVLAAIVESKASGKGLICPPGYVVKLTASVDFSGIGLIDIQSDILITSGTITVGGLIDQPKTMDFRFNDVTNGSSIFGTPPVTPVLKIVGVNNGYCRVGSCNHIQMYADSTVPKNRLVAYNTFDFLGTTGLLTITDSGAVSSYVNENWINGTRLFKYRIIGVGYVHNHNKLFNPTFEGSLVELTFVKASTNQVYGARFEDVAASSGVSFDSASYSNTVLSTWSGSGTPRNQFIVPIHVSDLGSGNMVTTEASTQFNKTEVISVCANSLILSTSSDTIADDPRISQSGLTYDNLTSKCLITPSILGLYVDTAFAYVAISGMIPVQLGDVFAWECDFDGTIMRPAYFVYDEQGNPILSEGAGGQYINQPSLSFDTNYGRYVTGADLSATDMSQPFSIARAEVKFVRVGFFVGTVGFVRNVSLSMFTQPIGRGKTSGVGAIRNAARVISGVPTKGYVPKDFYVFDRVAKLTRWVTFQHETKTTAALVSGATTATVAAPGGIANGDLCGIQLVDSTTHWSSVSALSSATFTIAPIPVGKSAASGAIVVFNRWAS